MGKLAIIPARGGSKRIPRKNIKSFLGKPIIAYSIETALASNLFDEVMVSTDDAEIAEIAIKYGAKVPFLRSNKNSDDFATTVDVLVEVITVYQKKGKNFEQATCIYPTAPLLSKSKLIESFEVLKKQKFDSVFSVVAYPYPIQRALKIDIQQKMDMFFKEFKNSRSQDLEKSYHDAGQFYTFSIPSFLEKREIWTTNTGTLVLNELEVQDIDNEIDWKLAELKYELLQNTK